jgi:hypothetical protein
MDVLSDLSYYFRHSYWQVWMTMELGEMVGMMVVM